MIRLPASITYSTVVSRDSVIILILLAASNDLETMGVDMQNAFLLADNIQKYWTRAGPEFGYEQGKLYALNLQVRILDTSWQGN